MPWGVQKDRRCPSWKPWAVVNLQTNAVEGCHASKAKARKQQQALYANEPSASKEPSMSATLPSPCGCTPRERAARARAVAHHLRRHSRGAGPLTLAVRLDRWAARQGDEGDWDEDCGHLVQAVDAVLDEALEAFQAGEAAQGVDLVVAAAATVDSCLEAMGLPDSDEQGEGNEGPGQPPAQPMGGMTGMSSSALDAAPRHVIGLRANVDESAWDGPACMSACAKSDTPASCYAAICAGRKAGDTSTQAAWALPHHRAPGEPPNRAGVNNALSRLPQTQGLTNRAAAEAHLNAHKAAMSAGGAKSAEPGGDGREDGHEAPRGVFRGVLPLALRESQPNGMPTLFGFFARFNEWTEILSFWEGEFMERLDPRVFDRTFREERDGMRVLFQHGRDFATGSKPLGPIDVLEARDEGAWAEVPLLDADYVHALLPALRQGLFGQSFRFEVLEDSWVEKPPASGYNPRALPERTLLDVSVMEFGPVTFPAYSKTTAGLRGGLRSLTDDFYPVHTHEFDAAAAGPRRAGGGDGGRRPGKGADADGVPPSALSARERALRLRGI